MSARDAVALREADALCFVEDLDAPVLSKEDAHHLCNVLRLADGAVIATSNGTGSYRLCALRRARSARDLTAHLEPIDETGDVAVVERVAVAFALVKGERSEWAVQKLTELGVDAIYPLVTERSVVRIEPEDAKRRVARLARIAKEAAAQCRRATLPEIAAPRSLATLLADHPNAALAVPGAPGIEGDTRLIAVGPEGGFSPAETALSPTHVGLGETLLRSETAAVAAGVLLTGLRAGLFAAR